jgi:hypothetical protein
MMDRGFTVLNITFITTPHNVKQCFVTVMVWQATAYHTDRSNTYFSNKLLANFIKIWILEVQNSTKLFFWFPEFWINQVLLYSPHDF